jgi:hypothetical protein
MERAKPLSDTVPANAFDVAVEALTREQRRSRRKREVRKTTLSVKRMTKRELKLGALIYPPEPVVRPKTRGECAGGQRPCPFVSCKHNLFLDVNPRTGAIVLNFPDLEPDELAETCCLDIADRGGATLEDVGALMNFTRERCRQVEMKAFRRLLLIHEVSQLVEGELRVPVRRHAPEDEL